MALVCDNESSTPAAAEETASAAAVDDNDLEDGEIEDDGDDEVPPPEMEKPKETEPPPMVPPKEKSERPIERGRHERPDRRRHEEKKKHMTEAEKSILHLRKRERMQREKWEKYRKEQNLEVPAVFPAVDDFAINIEKAIASVLKKDKHAISGDEEKDEEKRARKRKNRDKERPKGGKQRKLDSPKSEDVEDAEFLRGASPKSDEKKERSPSPPRSEESYDSEYSSDISKGEERRERKRDYKKGAKGRSRERNRKKSRERRTDQSQFKDQQGVCVFFLQGKCQKNDCPYSHEAMPPMKLELCKFYLKDCCAKGEKCSYMHSEFPCKFYHTGLVCLQGDNCKFDHGGPLDEHRRQILFKHIETAPREILGGFPRMSREEALNKINLTQQNLIVQYGGERDEKGMMNIFDINVPGPLEANCDVSKPKHEKPSRNRPSRWQDPDPPIDSVAPPFPPIKPFVTYGAPQDQDMRITSNGDIDMRTLPPIAQIAPQNMSGGGGIEEPCSMDADANNFTQDIDIRNPNMLQFDTKDVDIRMDPRLLATKDVDIRQIPPVFDEDENRLQIDVGEKVNEGLPVDLPKTQRELYLRIQSQQKTNLPEQPSETVEVDENINWYSDDDDEDENRLTIKVDAEEERRDEQSDSGTIMSPTQIKPQEVVEKLGDLSKIDISAEVTKLLTSMSQKKEAIKVQQQQQQQQQAEVPAIRDPRQQRQTSQQQQQQQPNEQKISIYEQGSIMGDNGPRSPDEVVEDFRGRPDVDLRNLHLPFKGMLNYTPAKEIDASVNSHPPMTWKVEIVEIPRPDYTGLKLNVQDAEKTGDPRLKKIFRLSTEEKDSPASPKASPKATSTRIDPRLKKIEDSKPQDSTSLSYNQQLNILQSSAFFQSLTSNQKLLLNQELASRNDPNGLNDPVLSGMLSSLNLIPNSNMNSPNNMGAALNILANVNKLNPGPIMGNTNSGPILMRQNPNLMNQMVQPGLLGAAPGIPNIPGDFPPINFDPRNMNNGPQFGNNFDNSFSGGGGGGGFDDYYQPPPQDNFGHSRDNRNFNRDRRRGRNNFNRNNGNRNFRNRNNRNNRGHTPP